MPGSWPKTDVWEYTVHTPAQLRALLEGARRDPAVLGFPYTQRRELVGEEPDQCQRGHLYAQPDHPYPAVDRRWLQCRCGGHTVLVCQTYQDGQMCGDQQLDPAVSFDCDVAWPPTPGPNP
jgi:hypothetical protein